MWAFVVARSAWFLDSRCSSWSCSSSAPRFWFLFTAIKWLSGVSGGARQYNWQHSCMRPRPFICSFSLRADPRSGSEVVFHCPLPLWTKDHLPGCVMCHMEPWGEALSIMCNAATCASWQERCRMSFKSCSGLIQRDMLYRNQPVVISPFLCRLPSQNSMRYAMQTPQQNDATKAKRSMQPQTTALQWGIVCREPWFSLMWSMLTVKSGKSGRD